MKVCANGWLQTVAAVQSLISIAINTLLDIQSPPSELGYYQRLREEAAAVFQSDQDWRDSASLMSLTHGDSAIPESLRRWPILSQVLVQEVIAKDGVSLPDGHHLPRGAWVGISAVGVHIDDRFYSSPH